MENLTVEKLIAHYKMQKHPEGGYYVQTFKSEGLSKQPQGERHWSTAIYYLLTKENKSRLHRIASDELWHFYLGDPLTVVEILPSGAVQETILGKDILRGQKLQHAVPSKRWFGAYLPTGSQFSFVGCTVAPGFDFADFEIASKTELIRAYPNAKNTIEKLT